MSVELKVPTLGESITEAIVGKWHKKVGDVLMLDEPVVVLETDKVTIDVQSSSAGELEVIAFSEGDKVKIGDVLGRINPAKMGTQPTQPVKIPTPAELTNTAAPLSTPVARAVAVERGVEITSIPGSGLHGRVMKDDVLEAAVHTKAHTPTVIRGEERVRMTPLRKRVSERLLQAQKNAAILTTFNEIDMSSVMTLRKEYNERFEKKHGIKLGFMSFFIKAAVEALQMFPAVNAFIDGEDVVFHHYYDIGTAVSASRGLVVPVIRDAHLKSMAELEKTIADFARRAHSDQLTLSELQGGTFTISNGGIFGSMMSTPILNPPQSGILGMHNIIERPVVKNGQIVARPMMYVALSYDHRLIDGREAVQFLMRVKDCIETPERLLLQI